MNYKYARSRIYFLRGLEKIIQRGAEGGSPPAGKTQARRKRAIPQPSPKWVGPYDIFSDEGRL